MVGVVAIEVGADGGRARRRLAVLAPGVEDAAADVVLGTVGVDREDDVDDARLQEPRDLRVVPIPVDEPVEDRQGHFEAQVFEAVVEPIEQDLGASVVDVDVLAYPHRPELAAPGRAADAEPLHEVGVGRCNERDLPGELGVRVVAGVARRKLDAADAAAGWKAMRGGREEHDTKAPGRPTVEHPHGVAQAALVAQRDRLIQPPAIGVRSARRSSRSWITEPGRSPDPAERQTLTPSSRRQPVEAKHVELRLVEAFDALEPRLGAEAPHHVGAHDRPDRRRSAARSWPPAGR